MDSLSLFPKREIIGGYSSEKSCVRAACNGNRQAFDELVARYEGEIRRYATRRVDAKVIDDLLQEVWLGAWCALPNFDQRCHFRTWLYAICVNKCRDHYRSMRRGIEEVALSTELAVEGSDTAEATDVRRHVAELTPNQREVLELYYYAQLNLPEISRVLNRNLNTVKYQFYRAHSELAEKMRETI